MRAFLRDRGYHVHGWKLGTNLGPTPERAEAMVARLHEIHARHAVG